VRSKLDDREEVLLGGAYHRFRIADASSDADELWGVRRRADLRED